MNRKEIFSKLIDRLSCDVKDINGEHCPNNVTYRVTTNRGDVYLCEQCLRNVKNGTYKGIEVLTKNEINLFNNRP